MLFLEVVRGHIRNVGEVTQVLDLSFRDSIYLFSLLQEKKRYLLDYLLLYDLKMIFFHKSRTLISVICVTLPIFRMTTYDFQKRHFVSDHPYFTPYITTYKDLHTIDIFSKCTVCTRFS